MPRPSHSQHQKEEIRNKIRAAAAKLYKEESGEKLTARKVAAEAGVSIGTLYAYFENLSEIMQSLWREPVRRLNADLEILASDIDCPKERLRMLMLKYVEFSQTNPSVFRNSLLFVRPEGRPPPAQVALERDRFFQIYRSTLREGQGSGVFRKGDLDETTQLLLSAIHGSIALPINLHRLALDPSSKVPKSMVEAMLEWLTFSEQ
ncbi:MAG: TetR/AcrR family transcriptional regulator [Pseudomonadota bacterium]